MSLENGRRAVRGGPKIIMCAVENELVADLPSSIGSA